MHVWRMVSGRWRWPFRTFCDEIGWQISCILKRTTVRVFFSFRFEFSHTKSFTFHWYPRGNIPKRYLVKGLRWMRQRYLRDRTHTYRFQMCVSICLEFRICHYILIYLKFVTYHIESSKYCLLKKSVQNKSPQFFVASYLFGPKSNISKQESSAASCQEQASSDACANLITGSLTVKSFADALQWKDPRFRTSGGWFIRVKNSGFTELRYDSSLVSLFCSLFFQKWFKERRQIKGFKRCQKVSFLWFAHCCVSLDFSPEHNHDCKCDPRPHKQQQEIIHIKRSIFDDFSPVCRIPSSSCWPQESSPGGLKPFLSHAPGTIDNVTQCHFVDVRFRWNAQKPLASGPGPSGAVCCWVGWHVIISP